MAARVLVSTTLPGAALTELARDFAVDVGPGEFGLGRTGWLAAARAHPAAEAIIPLVSDPVDGALMDLLPALRVVANYGVGYDNVDVAEARRRGIVVCNTPDVLTDATADLTWGLILAAARRVAEGDRFVRAGAWKGFSPTAMLGLHVAGGTLGIVGFGRIGRAVAARARGFGMRVLASGRAGESLSAGADERVGLDELLSRSDVVSLHCALTAETRGLIGAGALATMQRHAILVNTARGPIVDERALAAALRAGTIAGAGLDVFEHEPAVHPDLLAAPGVVLTPHVGSASLAARAAMAALACGAVRDVLEGRTPRHPVG